MAGKLSYSPNSVSVILVIFQARRILQVACITFEGLDFAMKMLMRQVENYNELSLVLCHVGSFRSGKESWNSEPAWLPAGSSVLFPTTAMEKKPICS